MKLTIFIFAAFLLLGSISALAGIKPEFSGAWYNPVQSGHGLSIEVIDSERSIAFWYAYDMSGRPLFLLADGVNIGNQIQAKVYYYEGMIWGVFDPTANTRSEWGTLTITFHDCRNATLEYDSTMQIDGEVFGTGQIPLYHLASIDDLKCFDFPLAGIYFGRIDAGGSVIIDPQVNNYAVVAENGIFSFHSIGIMLSGQLVLAEEQIGHFSISGTTEMQIDEGETFSGPFQGQGRYDSDRIALDFGTTNPRAGGDILLTKMSRKSSRSITLQELEGQWMVVNANNGWIDFENIDSEGSFLFTDIFGCIFHGQIGVPNAEVSLLEATLEISECGSDSGSYFGNGAFIEDESLYLSSDLIEILLWNQEGKGLRLRFISVE